MQLDTTFLERCIDALEYAHDQLQQEQPSEPMPDILRAACVKKFEIIVGGSGKLLRQRMHDYFANPRKADNLTPRDLLRYAAKHCLIDIDTSELWLNYHSNRTDSINNYSENFADDILKVLPQFTTDARSFLTRIKGSAIKDLSTPIFKEG